MPIGITLPTILNYMNIIGMNPSTILRFKVQLTNTKNSYGTYVAL
ncbi:hypothetical protein [Candidatus Harpocratesius sp.]